MFNKKLEIPEGVNLDDLKKVKRKDREKAIKLFNEYEKGIVIKVNEDINQKKLMYKLRKEA
jgi:hypothetical protein